MQVIQQARIKKPSSWLGCGILTLFTDGFVGQMQTDAL